MQIHRQKLGLLHQLVLLLYHVSTHNYNNSTVIHVKVAALLTPHPSASDSAIFSSTLCAL